ncbi:hypothetical protein KY366_06385 [Candidatus Woesearchaeota archaeon]|nr:hypothetical protein [Candidatus Woesearchaeota archaeon]
MAGRIKEEAFKHSPNMSAGKKVLLVLPALLSVSWIFYLGYSPSPYYGMELLSPSGTGPLMMALILFTIGYLLFLLMMFSENVHDFIWRMLGH